jgi:hypothetical protein
MHIQQLLSKNNDVSRNAKARKRNGAKGRLWKKIAAVLLYKLN